MWAMAGFRPTRGFAAGASQQRAMPEFNPYSAGGKTYGGGRPFPNVGRVGAAGAMGYAQRDQLLAARQDALRRQLGGR